MKVLNLALKRVQCRAGLSASLPGREQMHFAHSALGADAARLLGAKSLREAVLVREHDLAGGSVLVEVRRGVVQASRGSSVSTKKRPLE